MKSTKARSWLFPVGLPLMLALVVVAYFIIARINEARVGAAQLTVTATSTAAASEATASMPAIQVTPTAASSPQYSPTAPSAVPTQIGIPEATPTFTATATVIPSATPTTTETTPTPETTATAAPASTPKGDTGSVLGGPLILRAGPGTAYGSRALLAAGTSFTVLGQDSSGNWLYILLTDGQVGWVYRLYTNYAGTAATMSAPPVPATSTPTPTPTSQPTAVATPAVTYGSWLGQYFANASLSGNPTLERTDASVNFDWGTGSPDPSLPSDNFSVRWTGVWSFSSGTYRFNASVDDGVRLYVDGALVIDAWSVGSQRQVSGDIALLSGQHTVTVEYYEASGEAMINVWWAQDLGAGDATITDWKGEYYANPYLSGSPVLVRNDSAISFDWGSDGPGNGVPAENFSVRWSRWYNFDSGIYDFYARSDDGVRVYVDGQLIIDEWHDSPGWSAYNAQLSLSGPHWLVVEYYQHLGDSLAYMWWSEVAATPTSTPTATATATATPTETPATHAAATTTPTATAPATATATATPMATVEPTSTPAATATPTATAPATATVTPTEIAEPTNTPAATTTPTATAPATATPTETAGPTSTPTGTPTATVTATQAPTATPSPRVTSTSTPEKATATPLPTQAPSSTPAPTATQAPTATPAPTSTPVPSLPNVSGRWNGVSQPDDRTWSVHITQAGSSLSGTIELAGAAKASRWTAERLAGQQ